MQSGRARSESEAPPGGGPSPPGGVAGLRPALILLVVGALLSLAAALLVDTREQNRAERTLEEHVRAIEVAVARGFAGPIEIASYLPPFFEASEYVSPDEFEAFVGPALERLPSVFAVEWAPRVLADERGAFEATMRQRHGSPFAIKVLDASGALVPAPPAGRVMFPLEYRLPPLDEVIGLDLFSRDSQRAAIEEAVRTGRLIASERFELVHTRRANEHAVLLVAPVFEPGARDVAAAPGGRRIRGVATVLVRVESLVSEALRSVRLGPVSVEIEDPLAAPARRRLYPGPGLDRIPPGPRRGEVRLSEWSLGFQGRSYRVSVHGPPDAFFGDGDAVEVFALGTSFSLLISGALVAWRSIRSLRSQVDEAQRLGQYTLLSKLGEGGMGTVYRARHEMLQRPTAVKVIKAGTVSDRALERFEREVRYTSELAHPCTIAVYDYGRTSAGVFYYAMEYLAGLTLDQLVRRFGPQPAARVRGLLMQAAGSLGEAHALGLIHRDVKPANLMVCDRGGVPDLVKVLDFGLVKPIADAGDAALSSNDALIGTPLYMAPENIDDPETMGPASDVYALCAVGYFLLVGEPVFTGRTVVEVCARHLREPPVPPSERRPGASSPELDAVLLAGLAKSPDDRPGDGNALLERLTRIGDLSPSWGTEDARRWWETEGHRAVEALAESEERLDSEQGSGRLRVDLRSRARGKLRSSA